MRKVFKRALGKAKLPAFRLYDLRLTFASLLLAASAPITYVSAQLRHVNPSTTLRYYVRWIPNKGRRRRGPARSSRRRRHDGRGGDFWPIWNQIWNQTAPKSDIGHPGGSRGARFDWSAVKDSNLGPAD